MVESAGAAGAVVDESAGPGEVDCCLEQATRAKALMHKRIRLRFMGSPHCMSGRPPRLLYSAGGNSTNSRKWRSIAAIRRWMVHEGRGLDPWPGRGRKLTPHAGELLLGGGALFLLGRILRAALAERALINLAAAAPAVSLTHEKRSESML